MSVKGPELWNALQKKPIRLCENPKRFKDQLKLFQLLNIYIEHNVIVYGTIIMFAL